jgi:hypothetical protein
VENPRFAHPETTQKTGCAGATLEESPVRPERSPVVPMLVARCLQQHRDPYFTAKLECRLSPQDVGLASLSEPESFGLFDDDFQLLPAEIGTDGRS